MSLITLPSYILQEWPQPLNASAVTLANSLPSPNASTIGSTMLATVETPGVVPDYVVDDTGRHWTLIKALPDVTDGQWTGIYGIQNNLSAAPRTVTAVFTLSGAQSFVGVWPVEIANVSLTGLQVVAFNGALNVTPGLLADAITSGAVTPPSVPSFLYGITVDTGGFVSQVTAAGTGFAPGQTGFSAGGLALGVSEYLRLLSASALPNGATFTNSADGSATTYSTLVVVLPEAAPLNTGVSLLKPKRHRQGGLAMGLTSKEWF